MQAQRESPSEEKTAREDDEQEAEDRRWMSERVWGSANAETTKVYPASPSRQDQAKHQRHC